MQNIFIVLAVALIQLILFLGHWLIYKTAISFIPVPEAADLPLKITLIILSLSFVITNFLAMYYSNTIVRFFYLIAATWLGFLDFIFIACIAVWLVFFASYRFVPLQYFGWITGIFFAIAIATGIYGIINANNTRITSVSATLPSLPDYWKGKTVVFVSDIHLGSIRREDFAQKIADKINGLKPDAVFIGGDLFDGGTIDLDDFTVPFSKVSPPDGIYFITGNHEEFRDDTAYLNAVRQAGIKILDGERLTVHGLQIAGVDWKDSEDKSKYAAALDKLDLNPDMPSILLKHSPDNLTQAAAKGISLELSGHTHRGQVFPFNLIVEMVYGEYRYGLREFQKMQVYTSSGVGTWGPPMRVGTISEIVAITLE